ncbi:MAG TPA: efflux RND transporter periplasmic adaptor subunit [Arenimonas sp.]|uniref:efflux RND transporter periplasmic adaptor subunit n=1 Tax=Arenimonas sp. TaxID=1872635 RepID=UPI002CDA1703|nr:efflux RND transporter periplasmic adaptor subunit [Arenimonas sp.]HMB57738.1 efflux RND transporter periplasmic adaptor subunit [Arenimonas sp.]
MSASSDTRRLPVLMRTGAVALVVAGLALGGCKGSAGGDAEAASGKKDEAAKVDKDGKPIEKVEAVPVEVAKAARKPISASYSGTANLEAPGEAQVVAKTSGVMVQLLAEEGDQVKAGQVLARIDGDKVRLEAERELATVHKLENNYRRSQGLAAQKLVSAESSDQIRYDLESARASYELAKLELSYTNITAPISGVVAQRMVKPGNLINLNAPVFRIVNNAHLEGVLNAPEREMNRLKAGLPLRMVVDAVPGKVFEGRVDRISPVMDSGSGTFRVVCAFDNAPELRPGMFGRIEVVYDQRQDALTVPRIALLEDEGEPAVYVVRNNKAKKVVVQLGYTNGELAEIRSGLVEGDQVVTAGKVAIRDGSDVQIITLGSQPAAKVVAETAAK